MEKRLSLVGSDHFNHDYNWISSQIERVKPECITLEQSIDSSASLYWEFEHPLDKLKREHKNGQFLTGEFAAGIHYAREKQIPILLIDEFEPYETAVLTDMNQGRNFDMLIREYPEVDEREDDEFNEWTRRNRLMAFAINHHFLISHFQNILHIGGKGHYDKKRCIPLQKLTVADSVEILDAVNKTRHSTK